MSVVVQCAMYCNCIFLLNVIMQLCQYTLSKFINPNKVVDVKKK